MKKKQASMTVYIVAMMVVFLAFMAFAIDGTITFTNRMKLQNITEMTALRAASEFNYSKDATDDAKKNQVESTANNIFELLSKDGLTTAVIDSVNVDTSSKKILVKTHYLSQPIFLAFLGINGIKLEAQSAAQSEVLDVTAKYPGVNWLTPKAIYTSDILSKDLNFHDTAILLPLGNFNSASYDSGLVNFSLIDSDDDKSLSLGEGGFITIRLPAPVTDKQGNDLFIKEAGDDIEGYMVFAGIDNNPQNPYVQNGNAGDGISWVNISCAGTPEVNNDKLEASYSVTTNGLGSQNRFFGSGYFDIGASCIGHTLSMVKYIRIVDDNDESGFALSSDGNYYKIKMYGESASATSGADIDYIQVLNHVKLISASSFQ